MQVHLVDGTYELFRYYFALPSHLTVEGREVAATRGVLGSCLSILEDGATHVAIATDSVIESFRNDLYAGYKSGEGIDRELHQQFPLLEAVLVAAGFVVFPMIEFEADDALGAAARRAAADIRVDRVLICTPDKDLAQCVTADGRIVQLDRRKRLVYDHEGVMEKFGVAPESIPDYLGLVGDTADGFPGVKGWGAKSTAAVLSRYLHIEEIPAAPGQWDVAVRGAARLAAALVENRDDALLFRTIATIRNDAPVMASVDELEWTGPRPELAALALSIDAPGLAERALHIAGARR